MTSNESLKSTFFKAVKNGSVEYLHQLRLKKGAKISTDLARSYNDFGETPLLVAIRYRHFNVVKCLFEDFKVSVSQTGQFPWKDSTYLEVLPIFAAIVSDQLSMVEYLYVKEMEDEPPLKSLDSVLLSWMPRLQKINQLELVGAAFILFEDVIACQLGWTYLKIAMRLRQFPTDGGSKIPKIPYQFSAREIKAFEMKGTTEVSILKKLEEPKPNSLWLTHQALLITRRILSQVDFYPNLYTAMHMCMRLTDSDCFNCEVIFHQSMYILELMKTFEWNQERTCDEDLVKAWKIMNRTNCQMGDSLSLDVECNIQTNFSDCMFAFVTCYNLIEVFYYPEDKVASLKDISPSRNLLSVIAELVIRRMLPQLSSQEKQEFKRNLSRSIRLFNGWGINQPNYLHRLLFSFPYPERWVEAVQLLLEVGADPNTLDNEGKTPLHSLALGDFWTNSAAQFPDLKSTNFIAVLNVILEAGGNIEQVNGDGDTPLKLFQDRQVLQKAKKGFVDSHLEAVIQLSNLSLSN